MIKHCIIHFGLPKTGTTSIQKFLRHDLTDRNFCYPAFTTGPRLRDDCHNRAVNSVFRSNPEKFHAYAKAGLSREVIRRQGALFLEQLQREVDSSPAHTLLLSAEDLSWFPPRNLGELIGFLRDLGLQTRALAYIRQFKKDQESRFQQSIRDPGAWDLSKPRDPGFFPIEYERCFSSFDTFLGRSAVTVAEFKPTTFEDGCVVRDFCRLTGVKLEQSPNRFVNDSLSAEALKLLYAFRLLGPGYGEGWDSMDSNRRLTEKLSELKGSRLLFHSSLLMATEEKWRKDLDWVEERTGFEIVGNIYEDDDKPCVQSAKDMLSFSPASLDWLASAADINPRRLTGGDPLSVADAVGVLRNRVGRKSTTQRGFDLLGRAARLIFRR